MFPDGGVQWRFRFTHGRESKVLVLSRKTSESIRIGDNIEIRILDVSGGRVRLGISAPMHIPVHRSEIADRLTSLRDDTPAARQSLVETTTLESLAEPAKTDGVRGSRRRAR
jgi:carbon storage regulator